jgi:thymidylate kinase
LVGIDGAGKSTVLGALRLWRPDLAVVHWRDAQAQLFPGADGEQRFRDGLERASPGKRADLLFRLHQLEAEHVQAQLAAGTGVIVDSYWYKTAAREERLGRSARSLTHRLQQLPPPGLVIFLQIDPLVARARKSVLTAFEHPGDPAHFADFQRSVQQRIYGLVSPVGVCVVQGGDAPDAVARRVYELIEGFQPAIAEWPSKLLGPLAISP